MKEKVFSKDVTLVIKGMAILFMVIHHTFRATGFFKDYAISFAPFTMEQVVTFSQMSKCCVAMFVFVTGYGLYLSLENQKKADYSNWTFKRLKGLLSGYIFVFLICVVLIGIFDPNDLKDTFLQQGKTYGLVYFVLNMFGLQNFFGSPLLNGAWWYITAGITFIVIAPLMQKAIKKAGSLIVVFGLVFILRMFLLNSVEQNNIYQYLLIYALGMIFAKNNWMNKWLNITFLPNHPGLSSTLKLILELGLLALCYKIGTVLAVKEFWEVNYTLLPLLIILIVSEFVAAIPLLKGGLRWIGFYSFEIYLVHNYSRIYFSDYLYHFSSFWIAPILMLVFGMVFGFALHQLRLVTMKGVSLLEKEIYEIRTKKN